MSYHGYNPDFHKRHPFRWHASAVPAPPPPPKIKHPTWAPVRCVSGPDHQAPAALVASYRHWCGHPGEAGMLLCIGHATQARRAPIAQRSSRCDRCGEIGPLTLGRVAKITVHRCACIVRGLEYDDRDTRDLKLDALYDQQVELLCRDGRAQPVMTPGPLGNWERLPEYRRGVDQIAPSWRCTFSVVTCASPPG